MRAHCKALFVACLAAALLVGLRSPVAAADGTWTNTAGGAWPVATNWAGSTIADGAGFTADFSTLNITATATVSLNGPRTIGHLEFGDTTAGSDWVLNTGTGGPLTLATTTGTPTITVNNGLATLTLTLEGNQGFTKLGPGEITLSSANINNMTGGITIADGRVQTIANVGIAGNSTAYGNNRIELGATGIITLANNSANTSGTFLREFAGTGTMNMRSGGPRPLTTHALEDADFSGTIAGVNGSGELSLIKRGHARQTISGTVSSYVGTTTIDAGELRLAGAAALANGLALVVRQGGSLTFDNTATNALNRYNDASSVRLLGGTISLLGNSSAASSETLGALTLGKTTGTPSISGLATIHVANGVGQSAQLTFASVNRRPGATVNFTYDPATGILGQAGNNPRVIFTAAPTLSGAASGNAFFGSLVNGQDFATYGANGVVAVTTNPFATATSAQHALLAGSDTLAAAKTVASLKIDAGAAGGTLDLGASGAFNLRATNGILKTGSGDFTISRSGTSTANIGSTGSSAAEFPVYVNEGLLTFSAPVATGARIMKAGAGTLALDGGFTAADGNMRIMAQQGAVRFDPTAASFASGFLNIRGGVFELTGNFTRSLGTGSGQFLFGGDDEAALDSGGGWAAFGGPRLVNINNNSSTRTWNETNFVGTGQALVFGSLTADSVVDFQNPLILGTNPTGVAVEMQVREIRVIDNPNSTADRAVLSGALSTTGTSGTGSIYVLHKTGDGTLVTTANNSFSGETRVDGGTLLVNGINTGFGSYQINSGATLGGTGALPGSVFLNPSSTLAPGETSGVLNTGSLNFATTSTYQVDLNGPTAGTGPGFYDQTIVTGAINLDRDGLGGATLAAQLNYIPTVGDMLFILANDGTDPIAGEFAGLAEGDLLDLLSSVDLENYRFSISYFGDFATGSATGGNDVVLTNIATQVIPEPASIAAWLIAGISLLGLAARRRRTR